MATLPELMNYDAGRTIQFGEAGQKRKTLAEIGGFAASGDFKGAQAAAFAGGETEMGLHLKQMNDEDKQRLVNQAASWAYQANDPQKWEAGRKQWMDMGYDIGPFQSREALLSQALTIQDRINQSNADRNYNLQARQENRLASAANAPQAPDLVELYDPQTGLPYKASWNPQTRAFDRVGGVKAPSGTNLSVDPQTGAVTFQQGQGVKPLTEGQSKDTVFATRAMGALPVIDQLGNELTSLPQTLGASVPVAGNYLKSPEFQQAEQAGKEFLQAILRKDTGAAITAEETAEYGSVYLPRPGDSPQVLQQKQAARGRAVQAIAAGMPPHAVLAAERASGQTMPQPPQPAPQPPGAWGVQQPPGQRLRFNPETGELE